MKASERLAWAVEQLHVEPGQRLLEVGCGHGVAVTVVCDRLGDSGHVHALDRSATMVEATRRRNAAHIAAGRASVAQASMHEAQLDGRRFDTIFAVHLPVLLRGEPHRELAVVGEHLAPGGRFVLPFQPLDPDDTEATAARLAAMLARHGFTVAGTRVEGRNGCVTARSG